MITKKTQKTNKKATAKKQGYDLNNIATTKAVQPIKANGILHLFFSLIGFVLGIALLMATLIPMVAHAKQGTYIVEPFSCEVALANYHHLTITTKENNPQFVQEQLIVSLEAVTQELAEHSECKGVSDGK